MISRFRSFLVVRSLLTHRVLSLSLSLLAPRRKKRNNKILRECDEQHSSSQSSPPPSSSSSSRSSSSSYSRRQRRYATLADAICHRLRKAVGELHWKNARELRGRLVRTLQEEHGSEKKKRKSGEAGGLLPEAPKEDGARGGADGSGCGGD